MFVSSVALEEVGVQPQSIFLTLQRARSVLKPIRFPFLFLVCQLIVSFGIRS